MSDEGRRLWQAKKEAPPATSSAPSSSSSSSAAAAAAKSAADWRLSNHTAPVAASPTDQQTERRSVRRRRGRISTINAEARLVLLTFNYIHGGRARRFAKVDADAILDQRVFGARRARQVIGGAA